MNKLTISQVLGVIAILGALGGFVVKYGPLPSAMAKLEDEVDQNQKN